MDSTQTVVLEAVHPARIRLDDDLLPRLGILRARSVLVADTFVPFGRWSHWRTRMAEPAIGRLLVVRITSRRLLLRRQTDDDSEQENEVSHLRSFARSA